MKKLALILCAVTLFGCTNAQPIKISQSLSEADLFAQLVNDNKPIMLSGNVKKKQSDKEIIVTTANYNDIGDSRKADDELKSFMKLCNAKGFLVVNGGQKNKFDTMLCKGEGSSFVITTLKVKYLAGSDIGGYSYDRYISLLEIRSFDQDSIKELIQEEYEEYKKGIFTKGYPPLDFETITPSELNDYLSFLDVHNK
ncbi:MAG: hypothetical protein OIF51_16030 [Cellvibrionaceae bacterium]|nr:hypothetical protein [Cellvibrionaceae bacterium]